MAPTSTLRHTARAEPEPLWDAGDVAAFLQVHPATVRKMVNSGALPAIDLNGQMRFRPAVIDAWVDARGWYGKRAA